MSAELSSGSGTANQNDTELNGHHDNPRLLTVPPPWKFWYPRQDPDKPSFPYIPGLTLNIDCHVPPSPHFARHLMENGQPEPWLSKDYLRSVPQSKVVVDKPPFETEPPVSPKTARLVVTAPIAVGPVRGAQIVSCTIHPQVDGGGAQPFEAVAKIYDPLYYCFQGGFGHGPQDVVFWADEDYSAEAAAYEQLLKAGQTGTSAPSYYGSWTFCLPITSDGKPYTRSVRLILTEQLNGKTIGDTRIQNNPERLLPEEYRLETMARAMDGFVRQLQVGVDQGDFAEHNVILVPDPNSTATSGGLPLPRVVLIDYNNATVDTASHEHENSLLPQNPIQRFWNAYLWEDFNGWAPDDWKDIKFQRRWLVQRFNEQGQRQFYQPVPEPMAREVHESYEGELTSGSVRPGIEATAGDARSATPEGTTTSKKSSSELPPRPPTPPRLTFGTGPGTFRIFDPIFIGTPEARQKEHLDHLAAEKKKKEQLQHHPAAPAKKPEVSRKKG